MKRFAICLLLLTGCHTINKKALDVWTAGDKDMVAELVEYRKAAGKDVADLTAHSTKAFDDISSDEETALMAEYLATIQADQKHPYRAARIGARVNAHLNEFHSLKGN